MAQTVSFTVLGADQLEMKLKAVSGDLRFKGGRFALRKAANALAEIVRTNSERIDDPATDRSIPANLAVRFNRRLFDVSGNIGFRVGIRGGAGGNKKSEELQGNPGRDTRYWRHLEFGTKKMRAQPFMRKSLADNVDKISAIFVDEYGKALTRAIKRGIT